MVSKLEKMVAGVMPLHTTIIKPAQNSVTIPIKKSTIGNEYPNQTKRRQFMGFFFENLNSALYGGNLNDVRYNTSSDGNGKNTKPDVVDKRKYVRWETKATVSGDGLEISDSQFRGYQLSQYNNPRTKFLYSIFRHSLHDIEKKERTYGEIMFGLIEKTSFSLALTLRVLDSLSKAKNTGLVSQYMGKQTSWHDCFIIRSPTVNKFLTEPQSILEAMGLNPDDFVIQRYLSPENFRVNRRKISQFPIVKILDKNHEQWVNDFMVEYEREMEQSQ